MGAREVRDGGALKTRDRNDGEHTARYYLNGKQKATNQNRGPVVDANTARVNRSQSRGAH